MDETVKSTHGTVQQDRHSIVGLEDGTMLSKQWYLQLSLIINRMAM